MIYAIVALALLSCLNCVLFFVIIRKITKMSSNIEAQLRNFSEKYEVEYEKPEHSFSESAKTVYKKRYAKRRISNRSDAWLAQMERRGGDDV